MKFLKKIIDFFKIPKEMYMTEREASYFNKNINRLRFYKDKKGKREYYIKN